MRPKISLIVPHWPLETVHDDMLRNCVKSIPADEKIIIVNDGTGMGKAINKGFELATGDYFLVSNNDCVWLGGDILAMCDPDAITLPDRLAAQVDNRPRCFYCMPRWIYEKVGGYDEQFKVGYFEDDDMLRRWENAGIPFRPVNVQVFHEPGSTLNIMPNRNAIFDENKKKYLAKWHELPQ